MLKPAPLLTCSGKGRVLARRRDGARDRKQSLVLRPRRESRGGRVFAKKVSGPSACTIVEKHLVKEIRGKLWSKANNRGNSRAGKEPTGCSRTSTSMAKGLVIDYMRKRPATNQDRRFLDYDDYHPDPTWAFRHSREPHACMIPVGEPSAVLVLRQQQRHGRSAAAAALPTRIVTSSQSRQ